MKNLPPSNQKNIKNLLKEREIDQPIDLEVGAGVGWHAITRSKENPKRYLIAIERTKNKFKKFNQRYIGNNSPGNLLIVHSDAINWVNENVSSKMISKIFILYPNPYPKKSDLNKRFYAMGFMEKLIDILKPGGEIQLATNKKFYADETKEYLTQIYKLELLNDKILKAEKPRTHFEKKYLLNNEKCFDLTFKKTI